MKRLLAALLVLAGWQVYAAHQWGVEGVQARVYVATAFVALVFMLLYNRDPWWRNWFGRSLQLLAFAVFLWGVSVVLYRVFGDYPGRSVLIIVVADATLLAMCTRTVVLWAAQRRDRGHEDRDEQHTPSDPPK